MFIEEMKEDLLLKQSLGTHARKHIHTYTLTHMHMWVCTHICTYMHTHKGTHTQAYEFMWACTHIFIHTHLQSFLPTYTQHEEATRTYWLTLEHLPHLLQHVPLSTPVQLHLHLLSSVFPRAFAGKSSFPHMGSPAAPWHSTLKNTVCFLYNLSS